MNGALKMAGKTECVLCPDLLDDLPKDARSRSAIWETFNSAPSILWLLLTRHPKLVLANLPATWSPAGPANVCISVLLDGSEEENRQRVDALRKIPARYRAIWVRPESILGLNGTWSQDLHWVIGELPDGWHPGLHVEIAGPLPQLENWGWTIRNACHERGLACLLLPGRGTDPSAADCDIGIPHHPFKTALNLFESSPYGRLMRPKPSPVSVRSPATEVNIDDAPVADSATQLPDPDPDPDPCPGAVCPTARDEAVSPCDPPATAVMAPCADVVENFVHLPIDAVIIEPEDETPGERFVRRNQDVRDGLRAGVDAGFALLEIRDDELWRDGGFNNWGHYCESIKETTRSYINRIINHAVIWRELEHKPPYGAWGKPILPVAESQSRPLKKLTDSKQRAKAWHRAVKRADGLPTAKIVMDVVNEILGDGAQAKERPSRGEERLNLQHQLQMAVDAAESWDLVRRIVGQLIALK